MFAGSDTLQNMKEKLELLKQFLAMALIKQRRGNVREAQAALDLRVELEQRIEKLEKEIHQQAELALRDHEVAA